MMKIIKFLLVAFFNGRDNKNYSRFNLKSSAEEMSNIYHESFGETLLKIIETFSPKQRDTLKQTRVLLDCANGIGGKMTERFLSTILKELYNVEIINKDDLAFLNDKCGAEYVQKEGEYPRNAVERLTLYRERKEKVRCVSYDGDADRIVY